MKKALFILLFSYFLSLFQNSFFPHFLFFRFIPFLLVFVVLISLFGKSKSLGLWSAIVGGLLTDIFTYASGLFFGFYFLLFILIFYFLRFFLKKYVQIPDIKKI